jgi:hypothetical protein
MTKIITSLENKYCEIKKFNHKIFSNEDGNILLESEKSNNPINDAIRINKNKLYDLLIKLKLIHKISKLIIQHSESEVKEKNSKSCNDFFKMIFIFTQNIQKRLFILSKGVLKDFSKDDSNSTLESSVGEDFSSPIYSFKLNINISESQMISLNSSKQTIENFDG